MDLPHIINDLRTARGLLFEEAVSNAFNYLGFDSERIEVTEAESDVIVKSPYSLKPYFIVIECEAVNAGNQVSYTKLGQLRGNFGKYAMRYPNFSSSYKLLLGKPVFSDHAKENANEDVSLLLVDDLISLLNLHAIFRFNQDELESLLQNGGENSPSQIKKMYILY